MKDQCTHCGSTNTKKNGRTKNGIGHQIICKDCGRQSTVYPEKQAPPPPPISSGKQIGITIEQLRAKHDVRYQVNLAVKQLTKGAFLADSEFIQFAKIKAGAGYRQVLDHPDFEQFRGRAGGVTYWGHPEDIKELKSEGIMQ